MSSTPNPLEDRGITPQRNRVLLDPEPNTITGPQRRTLALYGWKANDVAGMTPGRAREILAKKEYKPGSRAFNKKNGSPLPDRYTDDAIDEANKTKAAPSAYVLVDEYTNETIRGENRLEAVLIKYQEANPGMRFRWLNPDLFQITAGAAQWQRVSGPDTQMCGLQLGFMPQKIWERDYLQPNLEKSARMTHRGKGKDITGTGTGDRPEDNDVRVTSEMDRLFPMTGEGESGIGVRRKPAA